MHTGKPIEKQLHQYRLEIIMTKTQVAFVEMDRKGKIQDVLKVESVPQTQKMNSWLPEGRDSYGIWEGHEHTAIFKMDNQQGPIVQHM